MNLTDFLLARIAEDEATARAAYDEPEDDWDGWVDRDRLVTDSDLSEDTAAHMIRFSPARILAECRAKRRITKEHVPQQGVMRAAECSTCFETVIGSENTSLGVDYVAMERWPCATMRLLALTYADHPDFRNEWRP